MGREYLFCALKQPRAGGLAVNSECAENTRGDVET